MADQFGHVEAVLDGSDEVVLGDAAWLEVEERDPLAKTSRFHRLRVATTSGERALDKTLATLLEENRKNVLIVPAEFCADGDTMRALEREVRELRDAMTLHWLPGLGGSS